MTTIQVSKAKDKLSELVKDTVETTEQFKITVSGREQAVLISAEEYDSLLETIEVLKDQNLVKQILESKQEIGNGDVVKFDDIREE